MVSYTAEEVRDKIRRGQDRSRHMDREEALRRRGADPEAPRPYPGWEATITGNLELIAERRREAARQASE